MKADVAEAALSAGAHIVNDISALTADRRMAQVAAGYNAGVVLMHMKGEPKTMQAQAIYEDLAVDVRTVLEARIAVALEAGIHPEAIAIDPGIGFGKTTEHNLQLLAQLDVLINLGYPLLVGVSRKRFLGELTGLAVEERSAPSLAAASYAAWRGAQILRSHDVKATCDALTIVDSIKEREADQRCGGAGQDAM